MVFCYKATANGSGCRVTGEKRPGSVCRAHPGQPSGHIYVSEGADGIHRQISLNRESRLRRLADEAVDASVSSPYLPVRQATDAVRTKHGKDGSSQSDRVAVRSNAIVHGAEVQFETNRVHVIGALCRSVVAGPFWNRLLATGDGCHRIQGRVSVRHEGVLLASWSESDARYKCGMQTKVYQTVRHELVKRLQL